MGKFINHYGLLNANSASEGNFCENSFLTTVRFLLRHPGQISTFFYWGKLSEVLHDECWTGKVFTNLPENEMQTASENDKNISADQLLAYATSSLIATRRIYRDLRFMHYDGRFIETKVWSFIKYKTKRKFYYKWILKAVCKLSIRKYNKTGETSGVLKVWTIYKSLMWELPELDWDKIFKTYYELDHPINTGVYNEDTQQ